MPSTDHTSVSPTTAGFIRIGQAGFSPTPDQSQGSKGSRPVAALYQNRFEFVSVADFSVSAGLLVAPSAFGRLGQIIVVAPVRLGFDINPGVPWFETGVYARFETGFGHVEDELYFDNFIVFSGVIEVTAMFKPMARSR